MKIVVIIAFLSSFSAYGQQDIIDPNNFNYDLLNQLVADEVNSIRERKRLNPLSLDQSLDEASNDQAKYVGELNLLTHNQKSKLKRTPYDRVVFYGGNHNLVGENLQVVPIDAMFQSSNCKFTYQKLAKEKIGVWHNCKPNNLKKLRKNKIFSKNENVEFFGNLKKIGYCFSIKNKISITKVTKSFQRPYRRELVNGIIDKECLVIAQTLSKTYKKP